VGLSEHGKGSLLGLVGLLLRARLTVNLLKSEVGDARAQLRAIYAQPLGHSTERLGLSGQAPPIGMPQCSTR
jgi:hypothetical protein